MIKKTRAKHKKNEENSNLLSDNSRTRTASKYKNHHQSGNHKRQQKKKSNQAETGARAERTAQKTLGRGENASRKTDRTAALGL
jgi:hypothetical protein